MGKRRSVLNMRRPSTCNGLTIYYQRKIAEGAASQARARSGLEDIKAFPCSHKSHFHIGRPKPARRRTEAQQ